MHIISHRGYWKRAAEKNTLVSLKRSFQLGFGVETDVRDYLGELVISHDMPTGDSLPLSRVLDVATEFGASHFPLTLALNIKSDGLVKALEKTLRNRPGLDCFVFDMSIPDMRAYIDSNILVFARLSEVEKETAWFDSVEGVWLDAFDSLWYGKSHIENLLKHKRVCIVSSELHQRDHVAHWQQIKPFSEEKNLMLCTDFPEKAREFFFV